MDYCAQMWQAKMSFIHALFKLNRENFGHATLSHKICSRKQTTEPKVLILVSFFFFSGEVIPYTNTSYCIHILWEVCRSIFYGPPCIVLPWKKMYRIWLRYKSKGNAFLGYCIYLMHSQGTYIRFYWVILFICKWIVLKLLTKERIALQFHMKWKV